MLSLPAGFRGIFWCVVCWSSLAPLEGLGQDTQPATTQDKPQAEAAFPAEQVAFYLAESEPAPSLTAAVVRGSDTKVYLHAERLLTLEHIARVSFSRQESGVAEISLVMTDDGAKILAEATAEHLDRPIAILVGDTVISAPIVRGKISRNAVIHGRFTRTEMVRIITALIK